MPGSLHELLDRSLSAHSDRTAIVESDGPSITYRDLGLLSSRVRDRLHHLGVRPGDRVGIYMRKSIDTVASIFGVLKTGAAYVPVDPGAPALRNAYILGNCAVRAIVMEERLRDPMLVDSDWPGDLPALLLLDGTGEGKPLADTLDREDIKDPAPGVETVYPSGDDLAYILYTSGSTGKPKGVMLSHGHAVSYIDWCSEEFRPTADDCFSSHAPFHFDLSILDIFTPIKHGGTLALVSDEIGKEPGRLASLIAERKITVWYSTPSVLTLLIQYGKLEQHDFSALRMIFFAGEVFPVKHLRALKALLPEPTYYNLYGPTETNVCTYYRIPDQIPEERSQPYPIGRVCTHVRARVVDEAGEDIPPGHEGELCINGPAVMLGYWNLPEQNERVFFSDSDGWRWYRTGDIVSEDTDGEYLFIGRRDRMVKKRGYRVELGEIESVLYRYPVVEEAAVVALPDEESGVRIKAFLSCPGVERPSIIKLKRFCAENLPMYMIPDLFSIQDSLPKTSTDKIDYQRLKEID